MGNYNPHAPYIVGEEWVPIRDEDVVFSPAVNVVEIGHGFTLTSDKQVNHGRYYINSYPESEVLSQVYAMNIYPAGREHLSGPIRRTIIPVNAGAVTGTFTGGTSNIPVSLYSPSDSNYITVDPDDSVSSKTLDLYFAANNYSSVLGGKRIVGVNLLHLLTWDPIRVTTGETADVNVDFSSTQEITVRATGIASGAQRVMELTPAVSDGGPRALTMSPVIGTPGQATSLQRIAIGEANRLWSPTIGTATPEALPWRYEELQRFEVSAGLNRLAVHYDFGGSSVWAGTYYLAYAALEVLYCEETRVAVGGTAVYLGTNSVSYQVGANLITLRDLNFNANPVLPAGSYVMTLSAPNVGDIRGPAASGRTKPATSNAYPLVNGLRELYSMPSHPGVQVNVTSEEGEAFTEESITVLPQLSLHASGAGAALVETHSYGRQAVAQVWGSVIAEQNLDFSVGSGTYPWVRFYARHWGATHPLLLTEQGGAGAWASIQPSELDALDEIVDGWREVTLRWSTTPTAATFRFTSSSEVAGRRWEVLGVSAPALSGFLGSTSIFVQVPSVQRLGPATYGTPVSGSSFAATWAPGYAPPSSGAALDSTTDLVLMLSQDPAAISGFSVTQQTQDLVGIGLNCGVDPCGIPTGIIYNQIAWTSIEPTVYDLFSRVEASGTWGTSTSGSIWGGSVSQLSVNGSKGLMTHTSANQSIHQNIGPTDVTDSFLSVDVRVPVVAATATFESSLQSRRTDVNNYYMANLVWGLDGTVTLQLGQNLAGSMSFYDSIVLPDTYDGSQTFRVELETSGYRLRARAYLVGDEAPDWQLESFQTLWTSGQFGLRSRRNPLNSNGTTDVEFDNFYAVVDRSFGYYELQRKDDIDTDWQTIMKASAVTGNSFNDYEARIGIPTTYRMRTVNALGFTGQWSSEVTVTLASPGVSGGCCLDDGHILVFTTNERQDGSSNLAYSTAWESGRVEEEFTFPEAGWTQFQTMYNRDFVTAFRPLERGGAQFSRNLLVQAAAISAPTLPGFRSLSDMAWDSVSYICVRDEDGNRWLANVLVPRGRVLRDRRLYMAPITVTEVTDTPSPVDPWS